MITFSFAGSMARSPNLAIACSWLPQTCITDTGERPIASTVCSSAADSARARAGSRNLSSLTPSLIAIGPRNLGAHVGRHQILFAVGVAQQLFVQLQRGLDLRSAECAESRSRRG